MSENYNWRRRQLKDVKAAKFGFDNNKTAGSGTTSRLVLSIANPAFGILFSHGNGILFSHGNVPLTTMLIGSIPLVKRHLLICWL